MNLKSKETLGGLMAWAEEVSILARVELSSGAHLTAMSSDNLLSMSATQAMDLFLVEQQTSARLALQSYKEKNGLENGLLVRKISSLSQIGAVLIWGVWTSTMMCIDRMQGLLLKL